MALIGFFLVPSAGVAAIVLSAGVAWKCKKIPDILRREGQGDDDWQETRSRALIGMAASVIGLYVSVCLLGLLVIGLVVRARHAG